jgi:hypothetical protein
MIMVSKSKVVVVLFLLVLLLGSSAAVSLAVARALDRVCFGKSYTKVHEEIDSPFKYMGRGHRALFHDPFSAYVIAQKHYPGDQNALAAALLHNIVDTACTKSPEKRRALEVLAKIDASQRKKRLPVASAQATSTLWAPIFRALQPLS